MRDARERVLQLTLVDGEPLLLVDSPPGAGKTGLAEEVVAVAIDRGLRVAFVAPRARQTFDFVRRLHAHFGLSSDLLLASSRALPSDVPAAAARVAHDPRALSATGAGVVVSTAAKLLLSLPNLAARWDVLIVDEAYQLTFRDLAPLLATADQALLIGDPGQLDPPLRIDASRFDGAAVKVHWPAPAELRRRFPDALVVGLPATRRLVADTVATVGPAFYPQLPFASVAPHRQLAFGAIGLGGPVDRALDLVAGGASLVGLVLPRAQHPVGPVDEELSAVQAEAIARMIQRQATVDDSPLDLDDIGCIDAHVSSGAALRRRIRAHGLSTERILVDTPEIWQGSERQVMVVKHPLAGGEPLDGFGLAPGRWCVSLSRHRVACVIVLRDGVRGALDAHRHDCAERPAGAVNREWAGWQAHVRVLDDLARQGRLIAV